MGSMGSLEIALTFGGIAYGCLLVAAFFVSNKVTELFRIDTLFMARASESTRVINLLAGLLLIGYNVYTLLPR